MKTDITPLLGKIHQGDCLDLLGQIPDKSIDMILCDLPYGTTDCSWDVNINLPKLWLHYEAIIKDTGAILLFGSEPFSSFLRTSKIKLFKYDWIWKKDTPTGFQHAKNMPLKDFEIISVFSKAPMGHSSLLGDKRMVYNPQGLRDCEIVENGKSKFNNTIGKRPSHKDIIIRTQCGYPRAVLEYKSQTGEMSQGQRLHPTQKPVPLCEYLIRTYTNDGGIVLDNCAGSGTTAIASIRANRQFYCCELEPKYCEIAQKRIDAERMQLKLF